MLYNEPVFRPPAEAFSLIVQTSIGCPYNKCTFCAMYKNKKYRVLSFSEIEQHIANLKKEMPQAKPLRAFLADGDALAAETKLLLKSVTLLKNYFPTVRRIGSYGSVFSLQRKSISDLKRLAAAGLTFIYLGLESGSGQVLKKVHKYSSPAANISACRKAAKSGIKLSLMIIAGLGGKTLSTEHIQKSAEAVNRIQPNYTSVLNLMREHTRLLNNPDYDISAQQYFRELETFIHLITCKTIFRSDHISNLLAIKARLPRDKDKILRQLQDFRQNLL